MKKTIISHPLREIITSYHLYSKKNIGNFAFLYKNANRPYSTSIIKNINKENNVALVDYIKITKLLKPILNVQDKLLAPIVHSEAVSNRLQFLQFVLSRVPDSNLVKIWLKMELEQDKIIIYATKNEKINELLREIINIKIEIKNPNIYLAKGYYPIKREYFGENKELFAFDDAETRLNKILNKETNKNSLYAYCYIIIFDNKNYYYIGSTTQIKNRFKAHSENIKNYIEMKKEGLNEFFERFLDTEINYLNKNSKNKKTQKNFLNFKLKPLYLSTNYLNKFKQIFPNYVLSKGEWLLLNMITDLIVKTLEESLIIKFQPKLNIAKKVVFKYFEWNDEFLKIYSKSEKTSEKFNRTEKYGIYLSNWEKRISFLEKIVKLKEENNQYPSHEIYEINLLREWQCRQILTLNKLCSRYNLKQREVLNNLNRYHHYNEATLRNPLKIVKINE